MAIFHFSIKIGSRGKGQSAIAAAAYRSGTRLMNEELLQASDYTRKGGIVYSEIALCANAPKEYENREILWNAVHKIEKQKNAQLWREFEAALPIELHHDEHIQIVRNFVKRLTEQGMCVDWSIHDIGKGNPHVHMMCTMRSILPDGTWAAKSKKIYELDAEGNKIFQKIDKLGHKQYKTHKEDFNNWNQKDRIKEWRIAWEQAVNAYLPEELHIDYRSYAEQGIDKIPTIHEGYGARGRERGGKLSDRCEYNRQTRLQNQLLSEIKELENQMFTVVNTVNTCKQKLQEQKVTPEAIGCEVLQARNHFFQVYQLYRERLYLEICLSPEKMKEYLERKNEMQESIQKYYEDLKHINELEQLLTTYHVWNWKKKSDAQKELKQLRDNLADKETILQYQKSIDEWQVWMEQVRVRYAALSDYTKESAEQALHEFETVCQKAEKYCLQAKVNAMLSKSETPIFFGELMPTHSRAATTRKQSEHVQGVIDKYLSVPSVPEQKEPAYFTREQLHQEEQRLKKEQQKNNKSKKHEFPSL